MAERKYISVIVPLRLEWEPCYWTDEEVVVGQAVRVWVKFRQYIGVVSAVGIAPTLSPARIRGIIGIEPDLPRISETEIGLWRQVAEYYLCSVGEVFKSAYPTWKIVSEQKAAELKRKEEAKRLKEEEKAKREAEKKKSAKGRKKQAVETETNNIIDETKAGKLIETPLQRPEDETIREARDKVRLTDAQLRAEEEILGAFAQGKPALLNGVTGSGKTEIYTSMAIRSLESGRNVLYLVPEIMLSRQLEARMKAVFGDCLQIFHSKETPARRQTVADIVRSDRRYIVLGARSALFLPHHDLGLVIVDEEHDSSYKQDAPEPHYNGRDTALMLSSIHRCNVVLGSATPSLESLYNCLSGKYMEVRLTERYYGAASSDVEIIDTSAERRKLGMRGSFSLKLIERIRRCLAAGEQVVILRTSRGYAPVLQCSKCGHILRCPHCNVSLTYHIDNKPASSEAQAINGKAVCHHCGYSIDAPTACPECGGAIEALGAGTQKIEEEAAQLFPEARIGRLDGDILQSDAAGKEVIRKFAKREIDILIGTQVVTKGFDFEHLSLVAVLQADSMLGVRDFRADEKALQTLVQFRGRCGRRDRPGRLVIQTAQPDHPVYKSILADTPKPNAARNTKDKNDLHNKNKKNYTTSNNNSYKNNHISPDPYPNKYTSPNNSYKNRYKAQNNQTDTPTQSETMDDNIIAKLMAERRDFGYPPFTRLVNVSIRHSNEKTVESLAAQLAFDLKDFNAGTPTVPPVEMEDGQFIRTIRITLARDKTLSGRKRDLLRKINVFESRENCAGAVTIDVDPS